MRVFCGIDWAEVHHDAAIVDENGQLVAKKRIADDPTGLAQLVELFASVGDDAEDPIPVAIETRAACWWPRCGPRAKPSI